jgi:hypothetical protein
MITVTERARKLRAQYMMQAQGLRTRIEIRVNRIPMALRRANMGAIFSKHEEAGKQQSKAANSPTIVRATVMATSSKSLVQETQRNARQNPSPMRVPKRLRLVNHYDSGVLLLNGQSDEISDKENDDLSNPKKRAKAQVPPQNKRLQPDQVLSPRSANSRTLPRSPVRPALSPGKSYLARPVSPLKPMGPPVTGGAAGILTNMVEKAKSTRATAARKTTASSSASSTAGAGRGKKAPQGAAAKAARGRASNSSQSTDASSGTTVVTKTTAPTRSPVKKTVIGTIKGIGATATKKPAATKAAPTRVLRKRA